MKQKAEITLEVEETIVLRQDHILEAFCPQCEALVEMITPRIAVALSDFSEREIFRLIEAGAIHFIEAEWVFICWNCLINEAETPTLADGSFKE